MSDESLRLAERDAAAQPSAASLSRLAFELAGMARREDAIRAALQAVAFDPSVEARDLLPPTWVGEEGRRLYKAVPWRGLRQLGRVRTLDGVPGCAIRAFTGLAGAFVDLGRGRVAYRSRDQLLGVDVLVGRVLWRRAALDPLGLLDGLLVALGSNDDGTLLVATVEPATGADAAPPFHLGASPGQSRFRTEDHVLVIHEVLDSHRDIRRPKRSALVSFDLRARSRLSRFDLPPMNAPLCKREGSGILVRDSAHFFGPEPAVSRVIDVYGRELWSVPQGARPEAVVDGRVLLDGEGAAAVFDSRDGSISTKTPLPAQGTLVCSAEDVFLTSHQGTLMTFDRATFEALWDGFSEPGRNAWARNDAVMATRDALLLIQSGAESSDELVSVEPRTAVELSRVRLGPTVPRGPGEDAWSLSALISGRAVVGVTQEGDRPLLVVEDGARAPD